MKKPNTKKADGSIETSYDFKHLLNATDRIRSKGCANLVQWAEMTLHFLYYLCL